MDNAIDFEIKREDMIKSVLIANRGEIALRIIQTAKRLGIKTIAVYSEIDSQSLYVKQADQSIYIGDNLPVESYLNQQKLLDVLQKEQIEAVHPGYGFLSENADFCQACKALNVCFIGPDPEAIRAMGRKDLAKEIMSEAGVPVTPGYYGKAQSLKKFEQEAEKIGYPVLIKASMGGGGKGIRLVTCRNQLEEAFSSAKREANASFGNNHLLIEKYIEDPRHIEVQILADQFGNIIHLYERECSIQRRHQKIIEEAPVCDMTDQVRKEITQAALKAAKAVNYINAGTVEFIVSGKEGIKSDQFWFMEMNTRLQVEHAITESILGIDLVEWQFRIASGELIPKQSEIVCKGHAIEARIYAEDPENNFLPSVGKAEIIRLPNSVSAQRQNFWNALQNRISNQKSMEVGSYCFADFGVQSGDYISAYYDPMIGKLISWGETRKQALKELMITLNQIQIWPIKTNIAFIYRLLNHPSILENRYHTGFIEQNRNKLLMPLAEYYWPISTGLARLILSREQNRNHLYDPWDKLNGFFLDVSQHMIDCFEIEKKIKRIEIQGNLEDLSSCLILYEDQQYSIQELTYVLSEQNNLDLSFRLNNELKQSWIIQAKILSLDHEHLFLISIDGVVKLVASPYYDDKDHSSFEETDYDIKSPMPGRVISVFVKKGDFVKKHQPLLILEAMKMEMTIKSNKDAVISEVNIEKNSLVQQNDLLIVFDPDSSST